MKFGIIIVNLQIESNNQFVYRTINITKMKEISFKERSAIFGRLEQIASQANMTKEERDQYRHAWKVYNDYFNCIDYAKKEGLAEGEAKGRAEEQQKLAKGFKNAGVPITTIAQVTGLSAEEIDRL